MADFRINVIVDPANADTGARRVGQTFRQLEGRADRLNTSVNRATTVDPSRARRGTRAIGRQFDTLGGQAERLRSAFQRTFAFVGVAAGIRELTRLADSYTNIQNRVRTVTQGQAALASTTQDLFNIAQRTRSSFEATTELYVRFTNATRELNVSQQQLLRFTESVNQAVILSGASAIEAQAGIIQLSQGLASGALQGDELRSVLEQLPAVADIIARRLQVTRGELRDLGSQGRITAAVVLSAFQDVREELGDRFAASVTTLSQAFTVFSNSATEFVGRLDSGTGVTASLASVVVTLAVNLDNLFNVVTAIAIAFAAYRAAIIAVNLAGFIRTNIQYARAVQEGAVVTLGSAEAERQKTAAVVTSTRAGLTETRQILATAAAERELVVARLANTRAVAAELLAERRGAAFAVSTNTHRAANVARLAEIGVSTQAINRQVLQQERELATATAAVTAATTARTAAVGNVAAAQTNANRATGATNSLLSRLNVVLPGVAAGFTAVGAAIAANPVGIAVAGIVGALALLINFSDRIEVEFGGGLVNLQDVGVATFTVLERRIDSFVRAARPAFDAVATSINTVLSALSIDLNDITFQDVILTAARTIDNSFNVTIGLAILTVESLYDVFTQFPSVIAEFVIDSLNSGLSGVEDFVNGSINAVNRLRDAAGFAPIELINFGEIENPFEGAGASLSEDLINNIRNNFDRSGLENVVNEIIAEAEFNRINDELSDELLELLGDSVNASDAVLTLSGSVRALVQNLAEETRLLGLNSREREIATRISQEELRIKGGINALDRQILRGILEFTRVRREEAQLLDAINAPTVELTTNQATLNRLYNDGRISLQTYNESFGGLVSNITGVSNGIPELTASLRQLNVLFPEGAEGSAAYGDAINGLVTSLFNLQTPFDGFEIQVAQLDVLLSSGSITIERYAETLGSLQRSALGLPDTSAQLAQETVLLNEAYAGGAITLNEYNQALQGVQVAQANLALESGEGGFADGLLVAFDRITEGAQNVQVSLTSAFANAGQALTAGFSNAAAQAIVQGENFEEVWRNAASAITQQLLSAIIEIGVQQAINFAAAQLFGQAEIAQETTKVATQLGGIGAVTAATVSATATTTSAAVIASTTTTGTIVADNIAIASSAAPAAELEAAATFGASAVAGLAALAAIIGFASANAFADGGYVSGPGGPRSDSIPASLSNGEFVMNADSTSKFRPLLEDMNRKGSRGFQNGGIVTPEAQSAAPASTAQGGQTPQPINIINVQDPAMVEDFLASPSGERTLVNVIQRNASAIRTVLG